MNEKKGCCCFSMKTYDNYLYTWCPDKSIIKNNNANRFVNNKKNNKVCTATPNSNGEDWNNTYVYLNTVNGIEVKRLAYMACDYVS